MKLFFLVGTAVFCALPARSAGIISGQVVETMDSGGYTYVRVEQGKDSTWVAVPLMKLKTGGRVSFQGGMAMNDFESRTLKRKFKTIVFSQGPVAAGRGSAHAGAPAAAKDSSARTAKAEGADAYAVAEIYAQRDVLDGKTVRVRGKVVKASLGIMDRNWIHLQDGSGDAKAGTHDLLVTTSEEAKVGEVVTARGVAAKDRDFGMGYSYKVLIEKASFASAPAAGQR